MKSTLLALLFFVIATSPIQAQLAPEAGYVFPPGGKAGTTIDVHLGGYNWTPDVEYLVSDPRVRLTPAGPPGPLLIPQPPYWFGAKGRINSPPIPRETAAKLVIPADVPAGFIYLQVANANGVSSPIAFLVGEKTDLVEPKSSGDVPRIATLPATVAGRLGKNEEVDRYTFTAPRDGPITCQLLARRLGSKFLPILEIRDAKGQLVIDALGSHTADPVVTFAAKAKAEYTVQIRDLDFAGDRSFVYLLNVTAGPRILAPRPAAGKHGETREIEFTIAAGGKPEVVKQRVTFPAKGTALAYQLETPRGTTPAFPLLVSAHPQSFAAPGKLTAPSGNTAVIDDEHRYLCDWKKGEAWSIYADARRIGSPLDTTLSILGPPGKDGTRKEVAQNDDPPGATDASLDFTVPADGQYEIVVGDAAGKGRSPTSIYRLEIAPIEPDFALSVASPKVAVPLGAKTDLAVKAVRKGGFTGPIALTLRGLPDGIPTPANLEIPANKTDLTISLKPADDAGTSASRVTLEGTATIGDATVHRTAQASIAVHLVASDPSDNQMPSFVVATVMKPRFKGKPVDQDTGRKVPRGSTHPAEITIERLDGFQGEITLQMAATQSYAHQGIVGGEVVVPGDVSKTHYPCFMPEWLESTRTSRMAIIAVSKVADPKGKTRHLASAISGSVTMTMEGALLKITCDDDERHASPGAPFDVTVKLARLSSLTEPVRIELIAPKDLKAEPVTATLGQGKATIQVTPSPSLTGRVSFVLRATAMKDGKHLVMSETTVTVDLTPAATIRRE